jgi:hypothetical protein
VINYGDNRLPQSFWENVSPEPNSGCWLWTGNVSRSAGKRTLARGTLIRNGKQEFAHRHAYEHLVRSLEKFENLLHRCGVSECCNPAHQLTTQKRTEQREREREQRRQRERRSSPLAQRARRSSILKCSYGITIDEYEAMLAAQDNRCKICRVVFDSSVSRNRPCVDHCHGTGTVRGILCSHCNTGIGYFDENPIALKAAAKYAREHAQRPLDLRVKTARLFQCLTCGAQGHNSRTCPKRNVNFALIKT